MSGWAWASPGAPGRVAPLILLTLLPILMLPACAGPVTRARGFAPASATQAALDSALRPRRIAVVVGVDAYDDPAWPPLRHAVADAQAVADALSRADVGAFTEVHLMAGAGEVYREDLLAELRRIGRDLTPADTFLFYFSGHGTQEVGEGGDPTFYLVAADTRQGDLPETGIELGALLAFMGGLAPQARVALFDSCFSDLGRGPAPEEPGPPTAALPWLRPPGALDRADALMMAADLGGAAQEDDALGHGVYTWALLSALTDRRREADVDGDGAVTAYEAHDLARGLVAERTGGAQIPAGLFRLSGQGDVILAGQRDPAAPEDARIYAYGPASAQLALSVDGRPRGAFPRTVPVEAGRRQLTLTGPGGQAVASGALRLKPGAAYEARALAATLARPTWSAGVVAGGAAQLRGPGGGLWGAGALGGGLGLYWRSRGEGAVAAGVEVSGAAGARPMGAVLGEVGGRRGAGRLDVGAGLALQLSRLAAAGDGGAGLGEGGDPRSLFLGQGWWIPEAGPGLYQGFRLGGWEIGAAQRLLLFPGGALVEEGGGLGALNARLQLQLGVRRGF